MHSQHNTQWENMADGEICYIFSNILLLQSLLRCGLHESSNYILLTKMLIHTKLSRFALYFVPLSILSDSAHMTHTHMLRYTDTHTHAYMHRHIHTCMCIQTTAQTQTQIDRQTDRHTHMYTRAHAHTHTHTHTHTRTHR